MAWTEIFARLEAHYGAQQAAWPVEPFEFLVWWHCGYPASDAACERGWAALRAVTPVTPAALLRVPLAKLSHALQAGGSIAGSRAERILEVAARADELRACMAGGTDAARRFLEKLPGMGEPGVDRILLFSGRAAVAAVPSATPQVVLRLMAGAAPAAYAAMYREASRLLAAGVPETVAQRQRAYLLLKVLAQDVCKRAQPACERCCVRAVCAYGRAS